MAVAAPKGAQGKALQSQDVPGITRPMTYEEYMAGPEEMARYDIIDGWKVYRLYGAKQLPNPTRVHQSIQGNLYSAMREHARNERRGEVILSPCDVLIELSPRLRTRQPDVLFISVERLAANPPADNPAPLSPAPELVVDIVSPSDRSSVLAAKVADYRAVDVREVWVVRGAEQTVEILLLSVQEIAVVAQYGPGQIVHSQAFQGLQIPIDNIFAV